MPLRVRHHLLLPLVSPALGKVLAPGGAKIADPTPGQGIAPEHGLVSVICL